ncbi:ArnT family glycosyltransferase [Persephonella sp.]
MPLIENRYAVSLFIFLTIFVFFWNIWLNDVWIPNEAFYAESAREMIENKNLLDIYYNYEPRFNKPPMTYWLVAISFLVFGISEFAVRLPIVLLALGSVYFTYKIGKELYSRNVGIVSAAVMAFSFQFVINSRYASPEIPLTFFFTATLYFFIAGYKRREWKYILLSYIFLGLTVLTKGYPYIIVIGGIVFLYILIDKSFNVRDFLRELNFLKIYLGIPLVLIIGFSWYLYMYLKFGEAFLDVTLNETLRRALYKQSKPMDIFFYIPVILWGFLPYSLVFFYALASIKGKIKELAFPLSWFIVMFVIFTIAKGKIPVYMIQAHVGMSVIVGYFLINHHPDRKIIRYIYKGIFVFTGLLVLAVNIFIIYKFELDILLYFLALAPAIIALRYRDLIFFPFISFLITFMIFTISILPKVEKYRPYDEIGRVINDNVPQKDIPLVVEGYFWHNLPFYAKRKVLRDYRIRQILEYQKDKPLLALVSDNGLKKIKDAEILWSGYLYRKGSESRFAILLKYVLKAEKGDLSGFEKRYLIYKR